MYVPAITDLLLNPPKPQTGGVHPPEYAPPPGGGSNSFIFPNDVYPYSGLPEGYRDTLLNIVMPQLKSSVSNLPGNIDEYTQNALKTYRTELDRALKEQIPRVVGGLANRGVLNSTVAENAIAKTATDAALRSATKGYETALQSAAMKTKIPEMLTGLISLSRSSSDPTVMYRIIANLLQAEM